MRSLGGSKLKVKVKRGTKAGLEDNGAVKRRLFCCRRIKEDLSDHVTFK